MIKVLVVDDSVFMRKALSRMLEKDSNIRVVGTASNGAEAIEKVEALKPDVATMDIEMPVMNGIEALKHIMTKHPIPVIMFSALTQEGADITLEALNLGACDFITKDFSNVSIHISDRENELITKVKNVANMKVRFLMKRLELIRKPIALNSNKKVRHEITLHRGFHGRTPCPSAHPSEYSARFPHPYRNRPAYAEAFHPVLFTETEFGLPDRGEGSRGAGAAPAGSSSRRARRHPCGVEAEREGDRRGICPGCEVYLSSLRRPAHASPPPTCTNQGR